MPQDVAQNAGLDESRLVYADFDWNAHRAAVTAAQKPDVIHGADSGTEYAAIDFKRSAAPVPVPMT